MTTAAKPTRKDLLAQIKVAGYHGDQRTAMQIYITNRIGYQAYQTAYAHGREAMRNNLGCTCPECKPPTQ